MFSRIQPAAGVTLHPGFFLKAFKIIFFLMPDIWNLDNCELVLDVETSLLPPYYDHWLACMLVQDEWLWVGERNGNDKLCWEYVEKLLICMIALLEHSEKKVSDRCMGTLENGKREATINSRKNKKSYTEEGTFYRRPE